MKKKSLLGAVMLSAALAVGMAIPAFAAESGDTAMSTNLGSSTDVKIATNGEISGDQVSVTVPLTMTVVAKTAGGDLMVPTAAYKISNQSTSDVNVTGAYTLDNSSFNLLLTTDASQVGSSVACPTNYAGYLKMSLTPAVASAGTAWNVGMPVADVPTWKVAKSSDLSIAVTGATSQLSQQFDNVSGAPTVLTFTYTVEKAK